MALWGFGYLLFALKSLEVQSSQWFAGGAQHALYLGNAYLICITLGLIWSQLKSVKISYLTVLGSGLCLMNETEVQFYQLLIVELSNLSLLPSVAQQSKLQCLSHFLLIFFWLLLWGSSQWVTRVIDTWHYMNRKERIFVILLMWEQCLTV